MKKFFAIAAGSIALLLPQARGADFIPEGLPIDNADFHAFGDVMRVGMPLGALVIASNKNDGDGMGQLAKGVIATQIATEGLKFLFNDTELGQRPNGGRKSFPSGHTSAAMSAAAFLQHRYGSGYGVPAFALGALTGLSRIDADAHHWRDIIAGTLLAYAISNAITQLPEKYTSPRSVIGSNVKDFYYSHEISNREGREVRLNIRAYEEIARDRITRSKNVEFSVTLKY